MYHKIEIAKQYKLINEGYKPIGNSQYIKGDIVYDVKFRGHRLGSHSYYEIRPSYQRTETYIPPPEPVLAPVQPPQQSQPMQLKQNIPTQTNSLPDTKIFAGIP